MPNIPDKDLQRINQALAKAIDSERRSRELLDKLGPAIVQLLKPTLDQVARALQSVKVEPHIDITSLSGSLDELNKRLANFRVDVPQSPAPDMRGIEEAVGRIEKTFKRLPAPKVTMPTKALTNEMRAVKKAISTQQTVIDRDIPEYTRNKPIPAMLVNELS